MAMTASRAFHADITICSTVAQVTAALERGYGNELRLFVHVMQPPADIPSLVSVLQRAISYVQQYQASLADRASPLLATAVLDRLNNLSRGLASVPLLQSPQGALYRRLSRFPAWALLLEQQPDHVPAPIAIGIGAALASAFCESRRFSPALATHVRRDLADGHEFDSPTSISAKVLKKVIRNADTLFKRGAVVTVPSSPEAYAHELHRWFRAQSAMASDKHQQAVFFHRTQSRLQFLASAASLRQAVEQEDNLALQTCIGALLHLRPDLVPLITILSPHSAGDWLIALDPLTGCLHFDLQLFADGGAALPANAAPEAVIAASKILVTPSPVFIAARIERLFEQNPAAANLGELAPVREPLRPITPTLAQSAAIRPSFARFRDTFGPFAVSIGLDRYLVSQICHTPSLCPAGKQFYAISNRREIWFDSGRLFEEMGWGSAVPLVQGLASGSQVVPSLDTVREWNAWMSDTLNPMRAVAAESLNSLIDFHNVYALAVASQLSFALCLRERKQIRITARAALNAAKSIQIGDKACGLVPGPRRIPLPPLVLAIIQQYFSHISAVEKMLAAFGVSHEDRRREVIRRILAGDDIPLFATITRRGHKFISSDALANWWPARFGLYANAGRHYMQNALRNGLRSSDVDWFVRHSLRGIAPSSSASTQRSADMAERIAKFSPTFRTRSALWCCAGSSSTDAAPNAEPSTESSGNPGAPGRPGALAPARHTRNCPPGRTV